MGIPASAFVLKGVININNHKKTPWLGANIFPILLISLVIVMALTLYLSFVGTFR